VTIGLAMIAMGNEFFKTLEKDPSRRTNLWEDAIEGALDKPILGYGYLAFWTNDSLAEKYKDIAEPGYYTHHGHNAYIDTFLFFGGVGLFLFLFIIIASMLRSFYQFKRYGIHYGCWRIMMITFFACTAITESSYNVSALVWVLVFYAMLQRPLAQAASSLPISLQNAGDV
jgi:O-antigen ligase